MLKYNKTRYPHKREKNNMRSHMHTSQSSIVDDIKFYDLNDEGQYGCIFITSFLVRYIIIAYPYTGKDTPRFLFKTCTVLCVLWFIKVETLSKDLDRQKKYISKNYPRVEDRRII